uniref:Putative P450 cytochrome n=1 Tax=Moniliophthora roreri TaxID=221103 RepID=A0A0W0FVR2_MONRR
MAVFDLLLKQDSPVLSAAIILALSLAVVTYWKGRSKLPLPPGLASGSLIYGNLYQLPKTQAWFTYMEWSKIYGPIFRFRVLTANTIVLNNGKSALDLLESRSSIYSDRPYSVMFDQLCGRAKSVSRVKFHDPRFRTYRRILNGALNRGTAKAYQGIQIDEVHTLLQGLAKTPEDFLVLLRRNAGAVTLKLAYGYQVTSNNDEFVERVDQSFVYFGKKLARLFLVDFFPILRFVPSSFPGGEFKKIAKEFKDARVDDWPFLWAKERIASGNFEDSFTSRLLRPEDGHVPDAEEEDIIKFCDAGIYAGGADTTVSVMTAFFFVMARHPEIQKRAQAEIDQITNKQRMPNFGDQESLPYITAIIKEISRWAPTAPLGVPHRVMQDDEYAGYRIPKGSTIIANIWAITRDTDMYPNPEVFDPERHLGDKPQPNPFKFIFGFGRRICPGAHLAEQSVFVNVVSILAVYDIGPELDSIGKPIEAPIEFVGGITACAHETIQMSYNTSSTASIGRVGNLGVRRVYEALGVGSRTRLVPDTYIYTFVPDVLPHQNATYIDRYAPIQGPRALDSFHWHWPPAQESH